MRLFVGIALADEVVRELASVVTRIRPGSCGLRWTGPESWHITLQFLGNATQEQHQCLVARLAEVRSAPVPVQLGELGCFDRVGVLFADVVVTAGLAALQQRVVAATCHCGFVAEARPFHPHITLARKTGNEGPSRSGRKQGNKKPAQLRQTFGADSGSKLRELAVRAGTMPPFTRFMAREFLLYQSHLGPEGAQYEVRARLPLALEARAGYTEEDDSVS